ncbi:5-formyltetrahydrofolate cyclo-ligase [Lentibacillus halodurans]|uniref:5-formyltetrahydrofolate cyclo-ligase n=1 Tax=Lentibacillus halodurans TaxID=237679 RepID=A0A1I0V4E4_9BACI|nr:5-formyltetrahydrofolate cyclo-ligase [Lentibacillus halodurans]SFA70960.1 5-formyltetrahydrofolate cyclo-ligase [Lentibacillus halodurans]
MEKSELRNNMIQRLKHIPAAERDEIEQALTERFVTSEIWKQSHTVGITVSHGFEWNTRRIIETAWRDRKTVCVPKCLPRDRKLDFYALQSYDQLEIVYHQLLEPKREETEQIHKHKIDLLVVPGLLFDRNGYRIGFGGGYYDRFLTDFPNHKLALAANMQIVDKLPAESFDIPVDDIITENGFLRYGGI